jgi:uncharacterized protein (UPF0333 family)
MTNEKRSEAMKNAKVIFNLGQALKEVSKIMLWITVLFVVIMMIYIAKTMTPLAEGWELDYAIAFAILATISSMTSLAVLALSKTVKYLANLRLIKLGYPKDKLKK